MVKREKVGGSLYHGQRVNEVDLRMKLRRAATLCKVCGFGYMAVESVPYFSSSSSHVG